MDLARMFSSTLLFFLGADFQAVSSSPVEARSPYSVKETHLVPRAWTKRDRADGSGTINLQIGLKQGNFEELERHLWEGE